MKYIKTPVKGLCGKAKSKTTPDYSLKPVNQSVFFRFIFICIGCGDGSKN